MKLNAVPWPLIERSNMPPARVPSQTSTPVGQSELPSKRVPSPYIRLTATTATAQPTANPIANGQTVRNNPASTASS
jgi:hypothetical protein